MFFREILFCPRRKGSFLYRIKSSPERIWNGYPLVQYTVKRPFLTGTIFVKIVNRPFLVFE